MRNLTLVGFAINCTKCGKGIFISNPMEVEVEDVICGDCGHRFCITVLFEQDEIQVWCKEYDEGHFQNAANEILEAYKWLLN